MRPRAHHDNFVRHCKGFGLIVGYENRGDADAVLNGFQLNAHVFAQVGIKGGKRLIKQEHIWLDHDGAGQGDALLLTARELAWVTVFDIGQAHDIERVFDFLGHVRLGDIAVFEAEGDVFANRAVREEGVILEDKAEVALVNGHIVDTSLA